MTEESALAACIAGRRRHRRRRLNSDWQDRGLAFWCHFTNPEDSGTGSSSRRQKSKGVMARPLQDGSPPEPVESIPNDGTRLPLAVEIIAPASFSFEDCSSSQSHLRDPLTEDLHPYCHRYQEPQDRGSSPIRTACSFCRAGHSVYANCRHQLRDEQPAMAGLDRRVDDGMVGNGRVHREQPEQEQIAREITARLRRIGDEMNTIYLQRAIEQERHRAPLIWHFYHFISEVLAVFFNPQGNLMP